METNPLQRGNQAIADAFLSRRQRGAGEKRAFDRAIEEFRIRYPDVPQHVAAELVRFLVKENPSDP